MTRAVLDQYFTDPAAVAPVLGLLGGQLERGWVLEPSFGGGDVLRVLAKRVPARRMIGVDIDRVCVEAGHAARLPARSLVHADYLQLDLRAAGLRPQVIVGNPPYSHAEAFVRKALADVRDDGCVAFLLRLGFLASARRYSLMQAHQPDVLVLAERPSFTADGKTDASEYGWFVWHRSRAAGAAGRLSVCSWKGVVNG